MFSGIETPRLVLDKAVVERNAERFLRRAREKDVFLRPHVKTSKSVDVAKIATGGRMSGITVSTLHEADYFARSGFDDILYAVGITENKFERIRALSAETGKDIVVVTDNRQTAEAITRYSAQTGYPFQVAVEIDCGEHRSGLMADDPELVRIATLLDRSPQTSFRGVMTHAGHSYASDDPRRVAEIAEDERKAAVDAAAAIREAGCPCAMVSVGSTPTFLHARRFDGVTEARCGVYLFFDLAQFSRKICGLDDIAVSVLATVIGHNRQARALIVDSGALALSKDIGANTFLPDAGYGYVCDAGTLRRLDGLSVQTVHQEHGTINVAEDAWFDRLPVGSVVRILPNHVCMTAAGGYGRYLVVDGGKVVGEWPRIDGW